MVHQRRPDAPETATFNPDHPEDVHEYIQLLSDLYLRGLHGADLAAASVQELSKSELGRRLLFNCHRVASSMVMQKTDPKITAMLQWMQKLTGMFAGGGS